MRKKKGVDAPAAAPAPTQALIPHDPVNEAVVIVVAVTDPEQRKLLVRRLTPDNFLVRENRETWAAIQETQRRGLAVDAASLAAVGGAEIGSYVTMLLANVAPPANVEFHVVNVLWDSTRAASARGPVPAFLEALRDPRALPSTVRSRARQVAACYDGYEDRRYLLNPQEMVREQMRDIQERVAGRAIYPYGVPAIDYNPDGSLRPGTGAAPKQITILTGVSGGGKTTLAGHMALGLIGWTRAQGEREYRKSSRGRRVLYGAWEVTGGMTLELLAVISLGWSRSDLRKGKGEIATEAGQIRIRERMEELAGSGVQFLANPFRRFAGQKHDNERNLDLLQGYIAAAGVDVFIGDLWKRILVDNDVAAEEEAILRQQAMAEEMGIHAILLQQQRIKGQDGHGVETRADTRPTREGIKGSSAYVEVADTILGVHYPYLTKRVDPTKLEVLFLKQRYGEWPLAVELSWDRFAGSIETIGRPIEYERLGEANEFDVLSGRKRR